MVISQDYIVGKYATRRDVPPLVWNPDSKEATNQHGLIVGKSGSGKTTLLKDMVRHLYEINKHIYVFDIKGDLEFHDDNGNVIGNYIKFTAWDSEFGINMYEFDLGLPEKILKEIIENNLELNEEQLFAIRNAGPKVQIKRIIELLKKNFFSTLGVVQINMLNNLFRDTYIIKGFVLKDYTTWLKPLPSLEDTIKLIEVIKECLSQKKKKEDSLSQEFLQNIKKDLVELKILEDSINDETTDEDKKRLINLIENKNSNIKNIFSEFCQVAKKTYLEDDIRRYEPEKWLENYGINLDNYDFKNSLTTLEQLYSYLHGLLDSEVFNDNLPPVKPGLNIFDISGQDKDIQRFFVDICIAKIFRACKLRGDYKNRQDKSRGAKVDTYAVVDETETVAGDDKEKKDPFSYLNVIAKESRSIGFGLLVAAQSPKHFPHEFLRNFHLQIILEMNNSKTELDIAAKAFGVDSELVDYTLRAFGNGLVKNGVVFEKVKLEACKKIEHLL